MDGINDTLRSPHGFTRARPYQIQCVNTVKAGNWTNGRRAGLRELNWNSFYNTMARRDRRFSPSSGIHANPTDRDFLNDPQPASGRKLLVTLRESDTLEQAIDEVADWMVFGRFGGDPLGENGGLSPASAKATEDFGDLKSGDDRLIRLQREWGGGRRSRRAEE